MKQQIQKKYAKINSKKKDKAYFAPKSELLSWINKTIDLEIKSIEQMITGAIFCQLLDAAHPGTVRMNKVNWKAKLEIEYISNFKIFQQGLSNNNIDKPINIDRLAKGKTQELIELLQWLYGHHLSLGINTENYNALKKRNGQIFVFSGEQYNIINNKIIRDDLSGTSYNNDNTDFQVRNNLKNKGNLKYLNANLRRDNFHTRFNYQNKNHFQQVNSNIKKNKKIICKNDKNLNNSCSSQSVVLSSSANSVKTEENINNKKLDDVISTPFTIDEQPEENMKENEDAQLNNIIFEGIDNDEKKSILQLEKTDGINTHDLKMIIRKLRVNNLVFKNNLGVLLNTVTNERNFFLNKLKDIEYLYFNPIIKNSYESKKNLLKTILSSQMDSSVSINDEGIAFIKGIEKYSLSGNTDKEEKNNNDIDAIIQDNKELKLDDKRRKNSQKTISVNLFYSKDNNKESDNNIQLIKVEEKKIVNKTQPLDMKIKNNENKIFSLPPTKKSSDLKNNIIINNKKMNNFIINPVEKKDYYNISSHILNESLHICNTENNPNENDINLQQKNSF